MAWPDDITVVDADGVERTIPVPNARIAHDAVDAGGPVKVGGKAHTAAPPAVADGDRANQAMTLRGAAHASLRRVDGTEIDPATEATADRIADAVEAIEALTGATVNEAAPTLVEGATGQPDSLNTHGAKRVVLQDPTGGDLVPDESAPFHSATVAAKALVFAAPAFLASWFLSNKHATDIGYLQFFDAASTGAVTLGTTVPKHEIDLKAGQRASAAGLSLKFELGIVIAVTTASHGATATGTGWGVNLGVVAA